MNDYIATFHTHYAAQRSWRNLTEKGIAAKLAPTPRRLSNSCGTCVRYSAETPQLDAMHRDVEKIVRESCGADEVVFENL